MPKKLLKIVIRRFIETIQAHNNSIKASRSGDYWQFQFEAYRDALIEAGIKFEYNYRKHYNGHEYEILTASISITSDMSKYHNMLTKLGFVKQSDTYMYCFKTY